MPVREFQRILVANRGEIATRIFRACTELGKQTVAIYSEQDSLSLHRYKADEAYPVGEGKEPAAVYLDAEAIIALAVQHEVDAIHPGYGFLSENAHFARLCDQHGIAFIGPRPEHLEMFGDKVRARKLAGEAGILVPAGTESPVGSTQEALLFAKQQGYPMIVKAVSGGGGRGMRVVRSRDELLKAMDRARSEAQTSFGNGAVYLEQYIESPRHIEVQVLADQYGHTVHLYERDCSIQRRHQKIAEVAPSLALTEAQRLEICRAAVRLMRQAGYTNAGTVEFLLDQNGRYWFIEVNPRIQVEHTITEQITGIDIVQAQIRIAEGYRLEDPKIAILGQEAIRRNGYAIQCRITTEDPANDFLPDTGRLVVYRSPGGFGVRLDGGNDFTGSVITPHYDSLLVKAITWGLTFEAAAEKMVRVLQEFRIRGVKTNIPFLLNVVQHPCFFQGQATTDFLASTPELFQFRPRRDRGTKLLRYIGHVVVNGVDGMKKGARKSFFKEPPIPAVPPGSPPDGTRQILQAEGPDGLARWVAAQKRVLITDTTWRDAHQSLLATRMRTHDIAAVAGATARLAPGLFSLEAWGGATFDTALRFLREDPWERLALLRVKVPNILLQMLIRGANAVGYANYPDNVVQAFIREAAGAGVDVFRIFDALNWLPGMRVSIEAVREAGKVAEAAICYAGDILDPSRSKYSLQYYVNLAKEMERAGAHLLGIKDMSGLLKPRAAEVLVRTLKQEIAIPIHLHTHDSAGSGVAVVLKAVEAGVDIVDLAIASMSGTTSQPSLNTVAAALAGDERATGLDLEALQPLSDYWQHVREYYQPWEAGLKAASAEVYLHEMPGGQYSNLRQQAEALGLGARWSDVVAAYRLCNRLLGDIVKVTPSSKAVGDFALFMVQNNLTEESLFARGAGLAFPESVVALLKGMMGQPPGGWPPELQALVLKGQEPITCRPGELLDPVDFDQVSASLGAQLGRAPTHREVLSHLMYPGLLVDLERHRQEFGDTTVLDTPTFLYGLRPGEEKAVAIEPGKTLIVKLIAISELHPDGTRDVLFEMNGQAREVRVREHGAQASVKARRKADAAQPDEIGASMPGKVVKVMVAAGERVHRGEQLLVTEAMKMENAVTAPREGVIRELLVQQGDTVEAGDLLVVLE